MQNNGIKKFITSPVDSFLNRKSKNAIANNAVAEAIERIEQDIERLEGLKASLTQSGSVQLSSASDVTDSTGMALPVTEKNPTIDGTLANELQKTKNMADLFCKRLGQGSLEKRFLWDFGDHQFLHNIFEYIPVMPDTANYLFLLVSDREKVYGVAAFPVDYTSRIFAWKHTDMVWNSYSPTEIHS